MNKKQAWEQFKSLNPDWKERKKQDRIALKEEWSYYTDYLCKTGQIQMRQYETWLCPF